MPTVNSIQVQFSSGAAASLLSLWGTPPTGGLGSWWSMEIGGTDVTLCFKHCIARTTHIEQLPPQYELR